MDDVAQSLTTVLLTQLVPHPMNPNVVDDNVRAKLARNIEASGLYPPLIVRPRADGSFEILDGHTRANILRELGATTAQCAVWEVSDEQALLLLATLNRLHGEDAPSRRGELLRALSAEQSLASLARLLPESQATLEAALRDTGEDFDALVERLSGDAARAASEQPQLFSFAVAPDDVVAVQAALDQAMATLTGKNRSGRALAIVARRYLEPRRTLDLT